MAEARNENEAVDGKLDIRAADVVDALARRNPNASASQVAFTAHLMTLIGATAQRPELLRPMSGQAAPLMLPVVLELALSELVAVPSEASEGAAASGADGEPGAAPMRHKLVPRGPVEILQGTGLGERIGLAEGRRRLAAYVTPLALEDWAGPLAGPTELRERLGIARSTLQDWRREGAVIGLLKGKRKHVFPLAQFVDGRPVQGLSEVVAIIGHARMAWLWLVEPDRDGGSHLADLKRGRIEAVLDAAREDFA